MKFIKHLFKKHRERSIAVLVILVIILVSVLFSVKADSAYVKKYDFSSINGANPFYTSLTQGTDGNFYGVTYIGGVNPYNGVIFQWNPNTNTYTKKYDFDGTNGANPYASLTQGTDGDFYGTTNSGGGPSNCGAIFQWNPNTNTYTKKYDFDGVNSGCEAIMSMIQATDGNFYGLTKSGGLDNNGVLFQWDPNTNIYTKKHDFQYNIDGIDGASPYGSMVQGADGNLYGMTQHGGVYGLGIIFQFNPNTNTYTKKYDFNDTNGAQPYGSLTQGADGNFYGMTRHGGANLSGVIFQWNPNTNTYTRKYSFDDTNGVNGSNPYGSLTQGTDGNFYGMTYQGGLNSYGVVFQWDPNTNIYTKKYDFDGTNGANPYGSLTQGTDGSFYGMTYSGGLNNEGVIFQFTENVAPPPPPPDTTPPTIISITPTDNSTGVQVGANLSITFSEPVVKGVGNITIKKSSDNSIIETVSVGSSNVSINSDVVTVDLVNNLNYLTEYYVQVDSGSFTDLAGTPYNYGNLYNWYSVETGNLAPTGYRVPTEQDFVNLYTYAGGQSQVGYFLKANRISPDNIPRWNNFTDGTPITNPYNFSALPTSEKYVGFDYVGGDGYWWSSTQLDADNSKMYYVSSYGGGMGLTYQTKKKGYAIRFLRDATTNEQLLNDGTYLEDVLDADSNWYKTVKIGNQVWSNQNLKTTKYNDGTPISNNTGSWSSLLTPAYCTYNNEPLSVYEDPTYRYGGNPFTGINDTNTWSFTTETAPDTTPPTITSLTPADNSTTVPTNTQLSITFSEPVKTVGNLSEWLRLKKASDHSTVAIYGYNSFSVNNNVVTLNALLPLNYSTNYYIQIDDGLFLDLANNSFTGIGDTTSWNFTTQSTPVVCGNGIINPGEQCDGSNLNNQSCQSVSNSSNNYSSNNYTGGTLTCTSSCTFNTNACYGADPEPVCGRTVSGNISQQYCYGWGENVGWINFCSSVGNVQVSNAGLSGYAYGYNIGWINLNGVTNDNQGHLSGYAWGENIGWIDFSQVDIDADGTFTGNAYSPNSGWITFGPGNNKVVTNWRPYNQCDGGRRNRIQPPGCMDKLANNYDASATEDGDPTLCAYDGDEIIFGCPDKLANNYDSKANTDKDPTLCTYKGESQIVTFLKDLFSSDEQLTETIPIINPIVPVVIDTGCMDPIAKNYNPKAVKDTEPSSCKYIDVLGCVDPIAINYNKDADITNTEAINCIYSSDTVGSEIPLTAEELNNLIKKAYQLENPGIPPVVVATTPFLEDIKAFIEKEEISNTIKTVSVASAAAVGAIAVAAAPIAVADLPLLPIKLWSLLMTGLGLKKRSRPWGTVYDSVTKQPLDPAYVVLKNEQGEEVNSSITDLDGRYGFLVEAGTYTLEASKTDYKFVLEDKDNDELYQDIYHGEKITISSKDDVISKNIPMKPINFNWNEYAKKEGKLMKFYSKRDFILYRISNVLFILGGTFSVVAYFVSPTKYNVIILAIYALLLILRQVTIKQRDKGSLIDSKTNEPLPFSILRVFNKATNLEIIHRVTDKYGKFYCLVPNGNYYLKIDKKLPSGDYETITKDNVITVTNGLIRGEVGV